MYKKKTGCDLLVACNWSSLCSLPKIWRKNIYKKNEKSKGNRGHKKSGKGCQERCTPRPCTALSLTAVFRKPFRFFTMCVYVGPRENRLTFESWFQSSLNSAVFWKYLHVPFIKIWRKGAVAARVVNCGWCWWYGTAALVFCGRGHDGGRRGGLVAGAGCRGGLWSLRRWLVNLRQLQT